MSQSNSKAYVLDTSALIEDPYIIHRLKGLVVVPITVIGQLDGLKKSSNTDIASKARLASKLIDRATAKTTPASEVALSDETTFKIARKYTRVTTLPNASDNKIIGTAEYLKKYGNTNVTLLTTDRNMRIAARERGVVAEWVKDEAERDRESYMWVIFPVCVLILFLLFSIIQK